MGDGEGGEEFSSDGVLKGDGRPRRWPRRASLALEKLAARGWQW